jgi:hypothetical protein
VCVIIDAHMRFQGDVLRRVIERASTCSLAVPFCHHNERCDFTSGDGHYYAGGRIVFRSRDGNEFKPLDAKWARDNRAGPRGCVMGACYGFRRDWYMTTGGQPLSILSGWGCDEQVLSIAAWQTGQQVEVVGGHVAHRWRPRPPWPVPPGAAAAVLASRIAMIQALVINATDRRELLAWIGAREMEGPQRMEIERLRRAMLVAPRSWSDWRRTVCEPEEIDGRQAARPVAAVQVQTPNIRVPRHGIQCPHCKDFHDNPPVTNTYGNGNKRHECPTCGLPFISFPSRSMAVA